MFIQTINLICRNYLLQRKRRSRK